MELSWACSRMNTTMTAHADTQRKMGLEQIVVDLNKR